MKVIARLRLVPAPVRAMARATAVAALTWTLLLAPAGALASAPAAAYTSGAVVSVAGAPFLWVADDAGVLHLVGDSQALAGRTVDWSSTTQLSLDQLRGAQVGNPWLSARLVKIGDAIFLPRMGVTSGPPVLFHVQSPTDLALIGVTGQNYGQLVSDRFAWEQQYGFDTDNLARVDLPAVVTPVSMPTPVTPTSPASTTAPAAAPATAAAGGLLSHVPRFGPGGDVSADLPAGRNWNEVSNSTLSDFIPQGTLSGEHVIAQWYAFNGSGREYTFLQIMAIDLAMHSDVTSAHDLSTLKMRFLCRDVTTCSTAIQPDRTVAGAPALTAAVVDSTMERRLGETKRLSGITTDAADEAADYVLWKMRDVFVIWGNYGYDIRLAQTDSDLSSARLADLEQILTTLAFRY